MQQRFRYLTSDQGGSMGSDFLAYKKQVQEVIQGLVDAGYASEATTGALIQETLEVADADKRKTNRRLYIESVEDWLKTITIPNKKTAAKKATVDSRDDLEDRLISDEEKDSEDVTLDPALLRVAMGNIKALLAQMEEARQAERYLQVFELRVDRNTGKVTLSSLNYVHAQGAYQIGEEFKSSPDIKVVTGGRRLKDHDDVVITVSQAEYNMLQELGATDSRETTPVARLINKYGSYRREVLKGMIRFQVKTDTFHVKEYIIEHAIMRLRALQGIEGAYSADIAEIRRRIGNYHAVISKHLLAVVENQKSMCDGLVAATQAQKDSATISQLKWLCDVGVTQIEGLQQDLAAVNVLQQKMDADLTQTAIAHWLLKQMEHIIENAKLCGELVDISGKKGISSSLLSDVTANAFEFERTFDFPPNTRILPAHQGIFDPKNEGRQWVLSSAELASGERNTRDVLFAFACVKAGLTSSDQLFEIIKQTQARTVLSRGYGRMSQFWGRSQFRRQQDELIQQSETINLAQTVWQLYYFLREKVRSTNESYAHAFKKVFADAGKVIQYSAVGAVEEVSDVTVRFGHTIQRDFTYQPVAAPAHLDQTIQSVTPVSVQVDEKDEVKRECIQEIMPAFKQWNPGTLYSVVDNFLQQFGGFFIRKYEASPFIWTMATLLGALSGGTAISGPAIKSFLLQCGCPDALANGFVNVSKAISAATTNNAFFQMVGTGSTAQQGLVMILDTIAGGADSLTAQAVAELKRNLPIIICVFASSTLGGVLLSQLAVFRKELGTVPIIAEFFTGLKFAGFGYESFMHEQGEKSAVANTAASLMNASYNAIRAAASFAQLFVGSAQLLTCHPQAAEQALHNFLRPWLDLTDSGARLLVSSVDVAFRVLATVGRGSKAVTKAGLETPVNMMAKTLRIVGLEELSKSVVRGKSIVATAVDDNFTRPMHNVTRKVRRGYATLMTQDDMYLGESPLRLSHSMHRFCQFVKQKKIESVGVQMQQDNIRRNDIKV